MPVHKSNTELLQHEATVDPFVQWRRGNRAHLVASVSATLRCGTNGSDVSHLSDASTFEVGSPAMLFGAASRQERVRRRVLSNAPHQIVERFQEIGPCTIPSAVVRMMQEAADNGPLSQRGPPIPESWRLERGVTSFDRTKPPSRADALAIARAMQLMHSIIDDAYTEQRGNKAPQPLSKSQQHSSVSSLRSLLPEPALPGGLTSVLQGLETQWVLEHLSVVDIGFAELVRQVKVQCVERGALLNYVRETLFDYLADFLSSERDREEQISLKESELRAASAKFDATCTELDSANRRIAELEAEVRRQETLHKYTIAKHIRDKQRLTRRNEHRQQSSQRTSHKSSGGHSSSQEDDDSEDMSGDDESTLAQLVRQKREEEPKVRRESMANPMIVPNSLQHVRERARIRVAESVDAAVMTDPVFFRSKLPESEKQNEALVVRQPRRERLPSVSLAKSVTHHYTQTDPATPSAASATVMPDEVSETRRGSMLEPVAPLGRRPSILNNTQMQPPRVNADEIRRRISMARVKQSRLSAINIGIQATVDAVEVAVQNVTATKSLGTQSSVLLQLHVGGAMQQSLSAAPAAVHRTVSPQRNDDVLRAGDGHVQRTSPSPIQRSVHTPAPSSRSPVQSRVSPPGRSPVDSFLKVSPHDQRLSTRTRDVGVSTATAQHNQSTQTLQTQNTGAAIDQTGHHSVGHRHELEGSSPVKVPGAKRLAQLVKPLVEAELSTLQSASFASSTKAGGLRLRNLKWMLGSISEVYMSASAAKFGPTGDTSTLLVKHFRTKYGFEKVADGYARDFVATLEAMISSGMKDQDQGGHGGKYPCKGGSATIFMHRRIFAYAQFCILHANQPCELDIDPPFHTKAFLFYLHMLDAFRIRGGKGFVKDLNDDTPLLLTPRYTLTTLEIALKDHLPQLGLELFLLAVQGAMNNSARHNDLPPLLLPAQHPALATNVDYQELVGYAHTSVPADMSSIDVNVPSWDLDILLEILVRSYDTLIRSLIVVGQRTEGRLHPLAAQMTFVVWNGPP